MAPHEGTIHLEHLNDYGLALATVRRALRTPPETTLGAEVLDGNGTRAYLAGAAAWAGGDLRMAATQFQIAAGYRIGDAALRLAQVLLYLGNRAGALAWCAVVSAEGQFPEELEELLARCYAASGISITTL